MRLIKLALHLKRRYSSRIRGRRDYRRGIFQERVQVESFLKSHGAVAGMFAIENIGVHLKVSSGPPAGEDRIKEVICERGCRI